MKKIIILIILNFIFTNFSFAKVPNMGLASYGFVCNAEKGSAKSKNEKEYIGFIDEENLFFYVMYVEEDNEFLVIENSPLKLGDIYDSKHKLKDVIVWYEFYIVNNKVLPAVFPSLFFYDEEKKNYYLIKNVFKVEKKIANKGKKHEKIVMKQFKEDLSMELLNKMQKDFLKNNKEIFRNLSVIYGSPVSAERIMKLHTIDKSNLYLCNKI